MSETIRVRSVLGRFLEHSRLFIFESPEGRVLPRSADLMPRNLDNRVEVVVPVEDARAQQEIASSFRRSAGRQHRAWDLDGDGTWRRARPRKGDRSRSAQTVLMETRSHVHVGGSRTASG